MPARLLTILLISTLLLACALSPAGANPPDKHNSHKGQLIQKVYPVADLVIPMQNGASVINVTPPSAPVNQVQYIPPTPQCFSRELAAMEAASPNAPKPDSILHPTPGAVCPASRSCPATCDAHCDGVVRDPKLPKTMEDQLMKLITSTIAPRSWACNGGKCTMDYFPLSGALVVRATPVIQEQVMDFLAALRRLQDTEVALEVRFVSVSESVFERLGIDFDVQIKPEADACKDGVPPVNAQPAPARKSSGSSPCELGMAFLNDKQVSRFMEAIQGDQRSHIMQAPKLTLLNGQKSSLRIADEQFFTTEIKTIRMGDQIAFAPINKAFTTNEVALAAQPVVSADRRFVNLNLSVRQTSLASPAVPLFPITVPVYPENPDGSKAKEPVVFTQYLQQPAFNKMALDKALTIPDGGTVLLGGWKKVTEQRTEYNNTPVLSKVPYVNRLFKTVGYGREVETILLMVTPRIIVNEQEERHVPQPPCSCPSIKTVVEMPHADAPCCSHTNLEPKTASRIHKIADDGEEQEAPCVDDLLAKYHKACAAGRLAQARKLAIKALTLDPTCFDKKR
jgi:type II secretory pathway component GspD/PulD (secretin)